MPAMQMTRRMIVAALLASAPVAADPLVPADATDALAGAEACKFGTVVPLGAATELPMIGVRRDGGLVAWRRDDHTFVYRAIRIDGTPSDAEHTVAAVADTKPTRVYAVDRGYIVEIMRWDWQHDTSRWWAQLVALDGNPLGPPLDLAVPDMSLDAGRVISGDRIAWMATPAIIAPADKRKLLSPHVQILTIAADGTLATRAQTGALPSAPAPATGAIDPILGNVFELATPPPVGPRGEIYEPVTQPGLMRNRGGKPVGNTLGIHVEGMPFRTAGHGDFSLYWSGARFLYPYSDDKTASLLPIDCRN